MKTKIHHIFLSLVVFLLFTGCKKRSYPEKDQTLTLPEKVDFNFHVRPILSDRCFSCHGPDENSRKANLRLDLEEFAFAMTDSSEQTYAIVPGKSGKSELIHRISSSDPDVMMPPPESNLSITEYEIEILKRWIDQGAEWKDHWAFIKPEKVELPVVSQPDWPVNPIDHFIMARLDQERLAPSPQAIKAKLIRRLSFDLRGIPPSLAEIDAFLADSDPNAYEQLVDQFMTSRHYGERMALEWLDLARYSDSHGYQDDLERSMWPWRDWIIEAFGKNLPYDQFVSWQLAGDLFPNAGYEQKLATAFNRNHKITQEVGVVDEEYRVEYVLDRVNTFSTSFLGLTLACAQCHDHKYDPISQKEYYSLFSFFNNVPEKGRVEYSQNVAEPALPIPQDTIQKYRDYVDNLIHNQNEKLDNYRRSKRNAGLNLDDLKFQDQTSGNLPSDRTVYYPMDYIDGEMIREEVRGEQSAKVVNGLVPMPGKFSGALEFNGENYLDLGSARNIDFTRPVSLSFWIYNIDNGALGAVMAPKLFRQGLNPPFEVYIDDVKRMRFILRGTGKGSELFVHTRETIPSDRWTHVVVTHDGSKRAKGVKIYFNGKAAEIVISKDKFHGPVTPSDGVLIGRRTYRGDRGYGTYGIMRARLDEINIFNRPLGKDEIKSLGNYNPLMKLAAKSNPTKNETERLYYHYLHQKDSNYRALSERLSEYKVKQERMKNVVLKPTMIMAEMDTVRPTFVLDRGVYNAPTEQVYPGTPMHVMSFPEKYPQNRLGLSKWLFDPGNPLTARVAVNRYWQMIFGRGIVGTPEDFGSQGDLPSHPKLLDWLARDFVKSDWNLKHLIKTTVMSATYRQSVHTTPELLRRDPQNILLARGPKVRLQAEMIRDHALAISGLLSDRVGGPSVKPYQPGGLWLQVASGNQPLKKYIQDHGENLYRKSMYTFWKRTLPPPSMLTFDASTREQCQVRRQSTNTPLQALVLLNDPQFIEASRLIAQKMMLEGGSDVPARISFAFRLATSRYPSEKELELLSELFNLQMQSFEENPKRAADILAVGEYPLFSAENISELAAYTVVANTILNLTETIRKG